MSRGLTRKPSESFFDDLQSMSKIAARLPLLLLLLVLAAANGATDALLFEVPPTGTVDEPLRIVLASEQVGHAIVRIDDGTARYRAQATEPELFFTPRHAGPHTIELVDSTTGTTIAQASVLVEPGVPRFVEEPPIQAPPIVDETPAEVLPVAEASPEEPAKEPLVQESTIAQEPVVEEPAAVPPPPRKERPTAPTLAWNRERWSDGIADEPARAALQSRLPRVTVDELRQDARGRYDLRVRAPGENALEAHGALDVPGNITFLPPVGTSTDIVIVDDLAVETATVRLAKDSQVDAIARCERFDEQDRCLRWITTDIPFTDHGTYVEFAVTHFSGYSGVLNTTYYYVENATTVLVNTPNKVLANLTFSDPSGSEWLIIGFSEYRMNHTASQGRVYLTQGTNILANMQKRVTEVTETNVFFTIQNYTGDGGTVSFLINGSTSSVNGNMTVPYSRILAIRLDGPVHAHYNASATAALTSNVDNVFGDDAGDALNITLDVRDIGVYLLYGGSTYNSDNTSASARTRLVLNGTVIKPDTYVEEEDVNTAETHIGTVARIVTLGTGTHTVAMQIASETTSTADWQYVSVGAVRLTDVFSYWYQNSSGVISTTSTTTPQNIVNTTNTTYASHNYTVIASGVYNASAVARRTDARTYINNVIRGNASVRPQDTTDNVAMGMVDLVTGVSSITANMTVLTNNAASVAGMKYADLLVLELGAYNNPILLTVPSVNVTTPTANGSRIKVNVSVQNETPISIVLRVDSPLNAPYNVSLTRNGVEWYNNTLTLNETGLWTFTFLANDTIGFRTSANATDIDGISSIEVHTQPNVTGARITPLSAFPGDGFSGFCNATAGADRPLTYNYTWFINGVANSTRAYPWDGISVGENHACAVRAKDHRVLCWGYNSYGELGINSTGGNRGVPTLTSDASAYTMVSAGSVHTCAIRASDGRILCWGRNLQYRLGTGDSVNSNTPVLANDTSAYVLVSAGLSHSCAIRANDSRVLCWGGNNQGQLGNNDTGISRPFPTLTNDTSAYVSVSAGDAKTCGIRANDSRVLCWGRNTDGELGNNDPGVNTDVPTLTSDASAYAMVSAGLSHSCAVRANDSRVLCWGNNDNGRLGNNDTGVPRAMPTLTNDTSAYVSVSAGAQFTCGIRANDSRVLCWGYNGEGELGNNDPGTDRDIPVLANGTAPYLMVSSGGFHSCAIRANDSRVLCWGDNSQGQIGNNDTGTAQAVPTLANGTYGYHGGRPSGQETRAAFLKLPLISGNNVTLQCIAYDGYRWSDPVNSTTVVIQNAGPPIINNLTSISAVTPIANQNVTVYLNFTAYDPDGVADLNDSTARFLATNGTTVRSGTCTPTDLNATSARYACNLSLTHYDPAGVWRVNVTINDSVRTNGTNTTTTFTVNSLLAIAISPSAFSFGAVAPGLGPTAAASNPLAVHNRGNVNISWLNITAFTLVNGSVSIQTSNITLNTTDNVGTRLVNATPLNLSNTTLPPSTDAAASNRSIYLYIQVPNGTPSNTFSSMRAWEVTTQ